MSETMFVVSHGEYSDYSVLCICRTKADAEAIVAKLTAGNDENADPDVSYYPDARVQEFPVCDGGVEPVAYLGMYAEIYDDGRTAEDRARLTSEWPFGWRAPLPRVSWRWVRAPVYAGKGGRLEVEGTDIERVRRVFSDRKAMLMTDDAMRAKRELRSGA